MKIRLTFIAAALIGLPAVAMAQTASVQIYGRIDTSLNLQKTSATATTAGRTRKFVSGDVPWLGFRGSEDLGNGLRAFFKLEHGFNSDTGALSSPVPNQFWNRETIVGLSSASLGTIQLGSQFTPSLLLTGRIDPYGRTNSGAIMPMFQQGLSGPLGYTASFNNSVQYISPSVNGLQAKVLVGTLEGAAPGGRQISTALEYTMDTRLFGAVTYDRVKIAGAAVGQPTKPAVDLVTTQAAITYRFDSIKLHGYLIRSKADGAPGMKGMMVGVSIPVSATGVIASSLQRRDAQDAANSDAQTIALQYSHNFSKRTVGYVGAAYQSNKGNATFGVWPSRLEAGPSPVGAEVSGYQIGMRHYF